MKTTRHCTAKTAPRATGRRWIVVAAAAAISLSGCSGQDERTPENILSDPAGVPEPSAAPPAQETSQPIPVPSGSATAEPANAGEWGAYGSQSEACTAVAADVVTVAFLPMSLSFGTDQESVNNAEAEIKRIKEDAPWVLTADFAWLQLIIDDYGEQLETGDDASLDGESFEEALEPIQEWLTETCQDPEEPSGEENDGADEENDEESVPEPSTAQEDG